MDKEEEETGYEGWASVIDVLKPRGKRKKKMRKMAAKRTGCLQ